MAAGDSRTSGCLAYERAWLELSVGLREALQRVGADRPGVLAYFVDLEGQTPDEVLDGCVEVVADLLKLPADSTTVLDDAADLWHLCTQAKPAAARSRRIYAEEDDTSQAIKRVRLEHLKQKQRADSRASEAASVLAMPVLPPKLSKLQPTGWKTRLRSLDEHEGNPRGREAAEASLRRRYADQMVCLMQELSVPSVIEASAASDPSAVLRRMLGGARAKTLRARVHIWMAIKGWMLAAHGVPWPYKPMHYIEYLEVRADEPCSRSTLLAIDGGMRFIEKACGIQTGSGPATHPMSRQAVLDIKAQLGDVPSATPPKKALPLVVAVIAALEDTIVDDRRPSYARMYAWWKAVQTWGAMRFDDHRGMAPSNLRRSDLGMTFLLTRTKTTGGGKKALSRPGVVAWGAYVKQDSWLECGLALWEKFAPWERDYFLVAPGSDLESAKFRELKYWAASAMSRQLMSELAEGMLLQEELIGAYSEHSPRGWLVGAASALGAPDNWIDGIGGWRVEAGQGYVQNTRKKTHTIQTVVANQIRKSIQGNAEDILGEAEIIQLHHDWLRARGVESEKAGELLAPLTTFCGQGNTQSTTLWPPLAAADKGLAQAETEVSVAEQDKETAVGNYVVSISGRRGHRRLHRRGNCPLVPGVDYKYFENLGSRPPEPDLYHDFCKHCWKQAAPPAAADSEDEAYENAEQELLESSSSSEDDLATEG